jgi:aminoglycoside/choline kinase family phosphotransferase
MPISIGSPARPTLPSSASTTCPTAPWCCWNGRIAPPDFCRPTVSTFRSRWRPQLGDEGRTVRVTGYGTFAARAERIPLIRSFLEESGYAEATRQRMQGDASTRIFERLILDGQTTILMNAPPKPDGPPVRDGKPYSAIAHLAEDTIPYVAMAKGLRERNLSAPKSCTPTRRGLAHYGRPRRGPYRRRRSAGADRDTLRSRRRPVDLAASPQTAGNLPVAPHLNYRLPRYDTDAFLIEAELLLDWYLAESKPPTKETRQSFVTLWREALAPVFEAPTTWVLRDYHSPNLMWLSDREDVARIGVLDFQDALDRTAGYDVASLLQDARVDVPEHMEVALLSRYVRARRNDTINFDAAAFTQLYATLAAQRATKILGIFARLNRRDGKPQYLRHMPRIWNYLQRSLSHPALAPAKRLV